MNLRDLHYLLAVAQTRNFKRAADLCHVSQPTLSMQIKKLEDYLGVRLFERTNKNVIVTDAGRRIAAAARVAAEAEQQIHDIARAIRDPRAGEFRLGAIPTLASYIFPTFMPALAKSFPRLQILLSEEKTERLTEQLKAGTIDAALLALPVEDPALDAHPLFDDAFLLAVSARHELAHRKQIGIDDLDGRKLLLLDEGHCLRDQALSVCHAHGAREEKSFRATSLETLRLMVRADPSLMTLMPAVAVEKHDGLRYIRFTGAQPSRRIGIVFRKTSARADVIAEMAAALAKAYRIA
ncbi:MAG: LysR family transcriptional regulator [Alphaproteobacteria bacterium]|nr:LysR family transcriptional regulator [Alphaproteobacteria bacterium]